MNRQAFSEFAGYNFASPLPGYLCFCKCRYYNEDTSVLHRDSAENSYFVKLVDFEAICVKPEQKHTCDELYPSRLIEVHPR